MQSASHSSHLQHSPASHAYSSEEEEEEVYTSICEHCKPATETQNYELPCGHEICPDCLDSAMVPRGKSSPGYIECPVKLCHKPVYWSHLQKQGVEIPFSKNQKNCLRCGATQGLVSLYPNYLSCKYHLFCEPCWAYFAVLQKRFYAKELKCPLCEDKTFAHQRTRLIQKLLPSCTRCGLWSGPQTLWHRETSCKESCKPKLCTRCTVSALKCRFLSTGEVRCLFCSNELSLQTFQKIADKTSSHNPNQKLNCSVCYDEFTLKEKAGTKLQCKHHFCDECLLRTWLENIKRGKQLGCPDCGKEDLSAVHQLLSPEELERLASQSLRFKPDAVSCAECGLVFEIDDKSEYECPYCKTYFNQEEAKEEEKDAFEQLKAAGVKINTCPHCGLKTSKNAEEECDHIVCKCGGEFCFLCGCKREPTMAHGTHYHRPSCKHYRAYKEPNDDPHPKCPECKKLGRRCDPPPDLPKE